MKCVADAQPEEKGGVWVLGRANAREAGGLVDVWYQGAKGVSRGRVRADEPDLDLSPVLTKEEAEHLASALDCTPQEPSRPYRFSVLYGSKWYDSRLLSEKHETILHDAIAQADVKRVRALLKRNLPAEGKFIIAESKYGGLGLFAAEDLPKGEVLAGTEYDGKLFLRESACRLPTQTHVRQLDNSLAVDGNLDFEPCDDPAKCQERPGKGALVNASKRFHNVRIKLVNKPAWRYFDAEEVHRGKHSTTLSSTLAVMLVTTKPVKAGQELLVFKYGPRYDWGGVDPCAVDREA